MAAIRRARQDFVCKLDPEASPGAQVDVGLPPLASAAAGERRSRRAWRSLGVAVSLSMVGLVGLPSNWLVNDSGRQAPIETDHARLVEAGGTAFAAMPLLPVLPVALQGVSLPSVRSLASAPLVKTSPRERVYMPSHERNTAHGAPPVTATRVATARSTTSGVRAVPPQLAAGGTSSSSHSQATAAAAAVSVPADPVAVTRLVRPPALGDALAPCARESVFARTWCEHQARLRYCDGRRGSPECTMSTSAEHGG